MRITQRDATPPHLVTALFTDSALLFTLSDGATLADLADRLGLLGERHTGLPTAIYFMFGMSRQPVLYLQSGM